MNRDNRDNAAYLNWFNDRPKLNWNWNDNENPNYGSGSRRVYLSHKHPDVHRDAC